MKTGTKKSGKVAKGKEAQNLRISYVDFAKEIKTDLPYLMHEYADGLYVMDLKAYYGETANRIHHALSVLVGEGEIELVKAPDKTYYIVCVGTPPPPLIELTKMQRVIVRFVMDMCKKNNVTGIRTDYSQLARILNISSGGLRATMDKLHSLGYILIASPSKVGYLGSMTLRIGPKLEKAFEDHHLAT